MFVVLGEPQSGGEYRAGHYREPFSLELGTGANYFAFLERSVINVLDPARSWGIGLVRTDPNETTMFALGVFQAGSDAPPEAPTSLIFMEVALGGEEDRLYFFFRGFKCSRTDGGNARTTISTASAGESTM